MFSKGQVLFIVHFGSKLNIFAFRGNGRQSASFLTVQTPLKLQILQSIGRSFLFAQTQGHPFFQLTTFRLLSLHCELSNNGYNRTIGTKAYNIVFEAMNKIVNHKYTSEHQLPRKKQVYSPLSSLSQHKNPHAAAMLLRKESQIELVKKKISALCVQEQRYAHKTINADLQLQKKEAIQRQSLRIQNLLAKQKNRQARQLQILKHRNLKTRADNYYRTKIFKQKIIQQVKQKSTFMRSRSRQHHSTISQNKAESLSARKERGHMIYQIEKKAQEERTQYLSSKREEALRIEKRQSEHLMRLGQIKDHQLRELSKLELMMVQKSNTSRAAYEFSRDRLNSRTSGSRFQTNQIIKTARERKPSIHNISLNFF